MIWRKACGTHLCLPTPTAFGWTFHAGSSHSFPVHCLNPRAPEAVLNLRKYGCKRGCEGRSAVETVQPRINEDCHDWGVTFYDIHKVIIHKIANMPKLELKESVEMEGRQGVQQK